MDALNSLLEPIRQEYARSPEFQKAFELAYPQPGKKVKKVKNKGTRYPGTNPVTKSAKDGDDAHAQQPTVVANGLETATRGQPKIQTEGVGKTVEDALNDLRFSETPR